MDEGEKVYKRMNDKDEQVEAVPMELKPVAMSVVEALERGQIDISIATAKKFPRDLAAVKIEMKEMACRDQETAASCSYALPRAGKVIEGPSVRLAEIAASCYGNLSVATRVVEITDEVVKSQSVAHDLQKNVRIAIEIPRPVQPPKNPRNYEAAMRDARHTAALAANSIAFRESVFKVIPRSLVAPVWEEAKAVASGAGRSFETAREAAMAKFSDLGVSRKSVYAFLGVGGLEAINTSHLQLLHGVLTAIEDGDTSVEAEFGDKYKSAKMEDALRPEAIKEAHMQAGAAIEKAEQKEAGREVKEYKLDVERVRPKAQAQTPKPVAPKPPPPEPPKAPEPAKVVNPYADMDPVYGRVQRKMDESKVSFASLLRVLSYWGLDIKNVKALSDIKLQFMRTADADWQGVLGELAMNPDEAA